MTPPRRNLVAVCRFVVLPLFLMQGPVGEAVFGPKGVRAESPKKSSGYVPEPGFGDTDGASDGNSTPQVADHHRPAPPAVTIQARRLNRQAQRPTTEEPSA
jgi:hypothetical protein